MKLATRSTVIASLLALLMIGFVPSAHADTYSNIGGNAEVGGSTVFYPTRHIHNGGGMAFQITSSNTCAGTFFIGMRNSASANQVSTTQAWSQGGSMRSFQNMNGSYTFPAGTYSVNGRIQGACGYPVMGYFNGVLRLSIGTGAVAETPLY